MARVQSVLGPIDTSEMGLTLMHEHVCCTSPGVWRAWPELLGGRLAFVEKATSMLARAREEAGVSTFVDLTPLDLGRDVRLLREVSERSGVQIIACTGQYLDGSRTFAARTLEELAGFFAREIESGMEGTDSRAGVIKVASDADGVTADGEKFLRAAARVHRRTGAPIYTHSYAPGRVGSQQADILQEEGADLNRVVIGHCNDTVDLEYLLALIRRGCSLGLDRFPGGRVHGPKWEERARVVKQLIDHGYAHRIFLSHDVPVGMTIIPTDKLAESRAYNSDGILFIARRLLPRLREMGVDEATLSQIMIENPRRFFEQSG